MSNLSVIIAAKNNAHTLGKCIDLVLEAPPKDKEVILVYGKSKDGTEEIAHTYEGKVQILRDDVSTGSAINTGVLNSHEEIAVYVEAHSFISRDAFLKILEEFERNPDLGYIVFYRYIPENLKGLTPAQRLMNFWRKDMRNATMGQFRAFRRRTFHDVGGFWVFPKGCDDLEFVTRMYNTRWKMGVIRSESWDFPRRSLLSIFEHEVMSGASESCWFHVYSSHPYAKKEYRVKDNSDFVISTILFNMLFRRLLLAPFYALKVGLRKKYLGFVPFYTLCHWSFIYGFFFVGKRKWWGKERWDERLKL